MGEPAIPTEADRSEACALAQRVLDAIRNDVAPQSAMFGPTWEEYERKLWLLAATLLWFANEARQQDILLRSLR